MTEASFFIRAQKKATGKCCAPRQKRANVKHITLNNVKFWLVPVAVLAIVWARRMPAYSEARLSSFTLTLRTKDPMLYAPGALQHYADCRYVGAIRVLKDDSSTWNLTRAHLVMTNDPQRQGAIDGYDFGALKEVLEDAAIPSHVIDLLDARTRDGAVFMVSDDVWIDCADVALAFEAWKNRTGALVGTHALRHVLRPDSGRHAWLDYRVSPGLDTHGRYSMVSLNGAFVSSKYLRQAAERSRRRAANPQLLEGCDEMWLNQHVVVHSGAAPIFVSARSHDDQRSSAVSSQIYYDRMSTCLSRLAGENAGKLDLIWSRDEFTFTAIGRHAHNNVERFPIKDDVDSNRMRHAITSDRVAGVTVVLVMETKPDEVASAVRHLRARHSFIREAVVWNNNNETMNHHMFPYDLPLRYVRAPKNFAAYSKYLGCLLARYEICYFQHERTRPTYVAGLYAAFLTLPDVIVAASRVEDAMVARTNLTFFDNSTGRLAGFTDIDEGAMVHKDLVRQFVARMSIDDSRSFHERAMDADIYFTYSQPKLPMVLTHASHNNNLALRLPSLYRIGKALAFTFTFAPSSKPATEFDDAESHRHKFFKATCAKSNCAFATSIDAWPQPMAVDFGHDRPMLKPARYYSDLIELLSDTMIEPNTLHLNSAMSYHFAVDGDLTTSWRARLPASHSFLELELLAPSSFVGVKLWCTEKIEPTPILQLGYFGQSSYETARSCASYWTKDRALFLLHYKCAPVRVQRARLTIEATNQWIHVAEYSVEHMHSGILQAAARELAGDRLAITETIAHTEPAPLIGRVVYALHGGADDYCGGDKLATLEEACELAAIYPGKVLLLYTGDDPNVSLRSLATQFAVVGSTCNILTALLFEAVPIQAARGRYLTDLTDYHHGLNEETARFSARCIWLKEWWVQRKLDAHVVFFEPHGSHLLSVLRNKLDVSPGTIFIARSAQIDAGFEESMALAHATTVPSKADYISQARASINRNQDRRIVYPLRTLLRRPPVLGSPTTPSIEEVVVLVTPATTYGDLELFNAHALPILQQRVNLRLANVSALHQGLTDVNVDGPVASLEMRVRGPKWRTLLDVITYVAVYPARVLWVLDASPGSAYFASFASVEVARFVAAHAAVPHWESRMLAWNATFEWAAGGFAGKARELLQGRFNESAGFADREHLGHDASDIVVEEWPIKRELAPFANTVGNIAQYLAEVVDMHRVQNIAGVLR